MAERPVPYGVEERSVKLYDQYINLYRWGVMLGAAKYARLPGAVDRYALLVVEECVELRRVRT